MDWNFNNEKPIYAQLIEQIELAVLMGHFATGSKLPGVRELAADAGVNPNTMQRALAELEIRGLLFSQRTSGRFVTDDKDLLHSLRAELAKGITAEYLQRMQALGCSKEEIHSLLQQVEEES